MKNKEGILRYFSPDICNILSKEFLKENAKNIEEIRIRINRPIVLKLRNQDIILNYKPNQCDILQTLEKLCNNSVYAYREQICNGFITVKGGHRVGITGTVVIEEGKIINVKYINSLNFRIAREILDCSNSIINQIIDKKNNTIYNTLIVSPPGKGKTTMLRDVIRKISNGIEELNFSGKTCGIVDERGEIAAMYKGIPQNNIGIRSDVIENVPKNKGIEMLLRSMAPEIIACDEIGSKEDINAIRKSFYFWSKRYFYNASAKQ